MIRVTVREDGSISLPAAVCDRYGLKPDTPIRVVEARGGILLVPLTDAPMSEELKQELAAWERASEEAWAMIDQWEKEAQPE